MGGVATRQNLQRETALPKLLASTKISALVRFDAGHSGFRLDKHPSILAVRAVTQVEKKPWQSVRLLYTFSVREVGDFAEGRLERCERKELEAVPRQERKSGSEICPLGIVLPKFAKSFCPKLHYGNGKCGEPRFPLFMLGRPSLPLHVDPHRLWMLGAPRTPFCPSLKRCRW